jgi:hypothetical protein
MTSKLEQHKIEHIQLGTGGLPLTSSGGIVTFNYDSNDFQLSGNNLQIKEIDHGGLGGLTDNDHAQYLLVADIDDTPVNGETAQPISSNWAFDHDADGDAHHAESHNVASHSDTTATGAELETLTDNSMADTLHRHSELSASDGTPDATLSIDADGNVGIGTATPYWDLEIRGATPGIFFVDTGVADDDCSIILTNDQLQFQNRDADNTHRGNFVVFDTNAPDGSLQMNPSGWIGLGCSPSTKLHIYDSAPYLTLHNSTEEDGDGGRESRIDFRGHQSGSEESVLARIQASHDGAADDEKGDLIFYTNDGSDGTAPTQRLTIDSNGYAGLGTPSPSVNFHVLGNRSALPVAMFVNDGDNIDRYGIYIYAGADVGTGGPAETTYYVRCYDGDGGEVGGLREVNGAFADYDPSDECLKENILPAKINALEMINNLPLKTFTLKKNNKAKQTGFIAQDVQSIYPDAVSKDEEGVLSYSRNLLVPILVKAIQEQTKVIEELKEQVDSLHRKSRH